MKNGFASLCRIAAAACLAYLTVLPLLTWVRAELFAGYIPPGSPGFHQRHDGPVPYAPIRGWDLLTLG